MRKTSLMAAGIAATLVAALTGCTSAPSAATGGGGLDDMKPIVLKYSDSNVESAAHAIAFKSFMDEVTEKTDGKITFETYFSGTLHPATEALSALQGGLTDITFVAPSNLPDQLPVGLWNSVVGQGYNASFPDGLTAGAPVQMAMYETDAMKAELEKYDAAPLATWNSVPNSMLCKEPVQSAEDVNGLAVRTGGPPWTEEVEALGMTNVSIAAADLYEGLQRGVIDCTTNVVSVFMTMGLWDEAKQFIPADFGMSIGAGLLMKKSVLDSLPLEVQQIIFDARIHLATKLIETTLQKNLEWGEKAKDKGVEFKDPSSFNAVLDKVREDRAAKLIDSAPAGVADPEGYIAEYGKLSQDWSAKVADILSVSNAQPTTEQGWIDAYLAVKDIDWNEYEKTLAEFMGQYRP